MAGYLKVLSSLTRSATTLSKTPAVLAPASCQSLQQRNSFYKRSIHRIYTQSERRTGATMEVSPSVKRIRNQG